MRTAICLLFIFLLTQLLTGQIDKAGDVEFWVRSATSNQAIEGAIIELKGHRETKKTNSEGRARFVGVSKGSYRYSISHKDHYFYFPDNEIKVTPTSNCSDISCCNCRYSNLIPLPSTSFYVQGKVVNSEGGPLEDVKVRFVPIKLSNSNFEPRETLTDEWGHYSFKFIDEEVKQDDSYEIQAKRKKYFLNSKTNLKIDPDLNYLNDLTLYTRSGSPPKEPKDPLIFIEGTGRVAYSTNIESPISVIPSFMLRVNLSGEKENIMAGLGWHFPYELNIIDSFETVGGQISEVETTYSVNNSPFVLSLKYYKKLNSRYKFSPFADLSVQFESIKPNPPLISEDDSGTEINSFNRIVPYLTLGISIKKDILNFEPYVSFSYLSLDSQSFNFNFFGRADSINSDLNVLQFSVGLNVLVKLIGIKKNENVD